MFFIGFIALLLFPLSIWPLIWSSRVRELRQTHTHTLRSKTNQNEPKRCEQPIPIIRNQSRLPQYTEWGRQTERERERAGRGSETDDDVPTKLVYFRIPKMLSQNGQFQTAALRGPWTSAACFLASPRPPCSCSPRMADDWSYRAARESS